MRCRRSSWRWLERIGVRGEGLGDREELGNRSGRDEENAMFGEFCCEFGKRNR